MDSMEKEVDVVDLAIDPEEVVNEIGSAGRYQIKQYALVLIPLILTAMYNSNFIFFASERNYRCKIETCETYESLNTMTPLWVPQQGGVEHKCFKPTFSNESLPESFACDERLYRGNISVEPCEEWVYEENDTIVKNLNLACSPVLRNLIGTMHYAGAVVSMPLMGLVSDRFGRKVALIVCAVGGGVIGSTKVLTHDYNVYIIIEFLESMVGAATYTCGFVLLVELSGKNKRYLMASLIGIGISSGEFFFGYITGVIPNYKTLICFIYLPSILFLSYVFLIDESIRWLLISGRKQRAKQNIMKAARVNKIELSEKLEMKLANIEKIRLEGENEENAAIDYKELFTSKLIMTRLLIAIFWWFSSDLVYYGLLLSSVLLPGNKHENFMLTAVMGILGDIFVVLTLNRFGRKKTLCASFLICGSCVFAKGFIPEDQPTAHIVLFLIGKMFIGAAYSTTYTYSSELFPTQVRSFLVGASSMFAGLGAIMAPMTPILADIMPQLPTLIYGTLALASGILAFFTPETLNVKLPDTIKEAESMK